MRKFYLLPTVIVLVVFTFFSYALAAEKTFKLRSQSLCFPEDAQYIHTIVPTLKAIEKATGGKVQIELLPFASITEFGEELPAISNGLIDMMLLAPMFLPEIPDNTGHAVMHPFIVESAEDVWNLSYKYGLLDFYREIFEKHNAYVVAPTVGLPFGFLTSFPVKSIKDFRGKKIESFGGADGGLVKFMGGTPATIPMSDLYMALKLGTIDGLLFTFPELEGMKLKEVCKFVVQPPIISPSFLTWVFNKDTWDSLPTDIQKTIEKVLKDSFYETHQNELAALNKVLKLPELTMCPLPQEEVKMLKQFAYKAFDERITSKGPYGKRVGEIVEKFLKDKGN